MDSLILFFSLYSFRLSRFCLMIWSSGTLVFSLSSWFTLFFPSFFFFFKQDAADAEGNVWLIKSAICCFYFFIGFWFNNYYVS